MSQGMMSPGSNWPDIASMVLLSIAALVLLVGTVVSVLS